MTTAAVSWGLSQPKQADGVNNLWLCETAIHAYFRNEASGE